jgi:glyoxylase-like metal-dependent hydrolase (beta-lactamase superfamily II)/rhodanese-related sulfurtransferase
MDVITIETPGLGDRSYVAIHDGIAVVIDPQRDIDRVLAVTRARQARITHVLETHIHNDYVTGGYVLADQVGADYVVNAADDVAYERLGVSDGDVLTAGEMTIHVLATPGHTFTHLAYAIDVPGERPALFSGGSLLYGSTGRPDLLGMEHAHTLASHQWDSAHRLADELPGTTSLLPTHGFGSFCAATATSGADHSTIANEKLGNPVLTLDRETFIETTIAGLDDHPSYYAHMAPANAAGPAEIDLSPPHLADAEELRRRIEAGEWVVDLRNRTAFAPGHVQGTLNFEVDQASFVTWLGWLIPWDTPLTLLGATADQVADAQRELVRIGIDRPAAAAVGDPHDWTTDELAHHRLADFRAMATARAEDDDLLVLDVRRDSERIDSHIPGSLHIPLHELPTRVEELPTDRPAWVHCAGGYRASIAVSLIARTGREVVAVDDDYDRAVELGLVDHVEAADDAAPHAVIKVIEAHHHDDAKLPA